MGHVGLDTPNAESGTRVFAAKANVPQMNESDGPARSFIQELMLLASIDGALLRGGYLSSSCGREPTAVAFIPILMRLG